MNFDMINYLQTYYNMQPPNAEAAIKIAATAGTAAVAAPPMVPPARQISA